MSEASTVQRIIELDCQAGQSFWVVLIPAGIFLLYPPAAPCLDVKPRFDVAEQSVHLAVFIVDLARSARPPFCDPPQARRQQYTDADGVPGGVCRQVSVLVPALL